MLGHHGLLAPQALTVLFLGGGKMPDVSTRVDFENKQLAI
jgi:hypothetical protein